MNRTSSIILLLLTLIAAAPDLAAAQDQQSPVLIKINRIVIKYRNSYAFYIPTFEFNMYFQKKFENFRSALTANYDYSRQDMGFGMSHVLTKFFVNPGVGVDDNMYFREVFSDSTGIWRRKQTITPFLLHNFTENTSIGLEFKIEREWSPDRRMGRNIVSTHDRGLRLFYARQQYMDDKWRRRFLYVALERSIPHFGGQFNYFVVETVAKVSKELLHSLRYQGTVSYRGNITPKPSPIIFIGGRSSLIGYEDDEFWGRQVFYCQNLFQYSPFFDQRLRISRLELRRLSLVWQVDLGQVDGASHITGFKTQTSNLKVGFGLGIGVNTDLPYMPDTDVYFLMAAPSDRMSNFKYYAGFGGWIN